MLEIKTKELSLKLLVNFLCSFDSQYQKWGEGEGESEKSLMFLSQKATFTAGSNSRILTHHSQQPSPQIPVDN